MGAVWSELGRVMARHWAAEAMLLSEAAIAWAWWKQTLERRRQALCESQQMAEIAAYEDFELRMPAQNGLNILAKRVCRLVATKSRFTKVAVLCRGDNGWIQVVASLGMDDISVRALDAWAKRVQGERRSRPRLAQRDVAERLPLVATGGSPLGVFGRETRSFEILLGPGVTGFRSGTPSGDVLRLGRATVVPCWSTGGRMLGALIVFPAGRDPGRRRTASLEVLAGRLARMLEVSALADKLMQAERMASLGQIAGGVAHALNNPLTAVLGFAELIGEIADQPRVQKNAETIRNEALRMRETVQRLLDFSRPGVAKQEPVHLPELLGELVGECRGKLEERGIELVVETEPRTPLVRGNRDRLRQVMEHLLNNAAQAIASAQMRAAGIRAAGVHEMREAGVIESVEGHSIRLAVSHDRGLMQVIVSDTGPGFREPGRVFDPYSTAQNASEGAGLGLSICYGIVREHGGEISAFNLHPRGAAVVVELPLVRVGEESAERAVA